MSHVRPHQMRRQFPSLGPPGVGQGSFLLCLDVKLALETAAAPTLPSREPARDHRQAVRLEREEPLQKPLEGEVAVWAAKSAGGSVVGRPGWGSSPAPASLPKLVP